MITTRRAFPRRAILSLLTASALVLSACGSSDSEEKSITSDTISVADYQAADRDDIQDGGTLTLAIGEVPEQQNALHADGSRSTSILWNWYNPQTLLADPEGDISPNPDYITDISEEIVDGNTQVTYKLNDKAKFNDGTPFDVKAFETTWKVNNGKDEAFTPSATDGYEQIRDVKAGANDKEVIVTFDGTYPWYQNLFSQIAHPALGDPANYNDYVNKVHPEWGAGPYTVDKIDFNRGEAVFVPNDKWWGDAPKLDKVIYRQMEVQAAVNAFKNGEVDATAVSDRERYSNVKDMADIDIRTGRATRNGLYLLNAASENLSDHAVREAIANALDRKQLSEIWFQGLPYHEDPPGSFTFFAFQEQYEDNFGAVASFDPDNAKKLLDEAGWKETDGDFRAKDGKQLDIRFVMVGESEQLNAQSRATQQMLKDVGINLLIETKPSSEFSKIWKAKDFDIYPMSFISGSSDGAAYFGQMYLSDSELNQSSTGTPELDKQIREMQLLPTADEQNKRANELEKEALGHFGIIPLNNGADIRAMKKGLVNYGPMGFGDVPLQNIGWAKS